MEIKTFGVIPNEAKKIRQEVFIDEQGFESEFDEIDSFATHIVLYIDGEAAGVCRVFSDPETGRMTLGRLAVSRIHRGKGLGTLILKAAEEHALGEGSTELWLHAQRQAEGFYSSAGYTPVGETDYDEDCPHVWMMKKL